MMESDVFKLIVKFGLERSPTKTSGLFRAKACFETHSELRHT